MFFRKSERYKKWLEKYKDFKGYEKAWIDNKKLWLQEIHVQPPLFPIIVLEKHKNKLLLDKVECFNDIFNSDYIGYEWDCGEYIIDSRGYKYEIDFIDMYHPVGFVYPSKIIKQFSSSEIKNVLKEVENIKITDKLLGCESISEIISEIKLVTF